MNFTTRLSFALVVFAYASVAAEFVRADNDTFDRESLQLQDRIQLRSGQSISGTVVAMDADTKKPIYFRSSTGDELTLDRRLVSKVDRVDEVAEKYNEAIKTLTDDAQSHRDMVTWLEEQPRGRHRFADQILFHRTRILHFEPNDQSARRKLGYVFLKDESRWVHEERFWTAQGYVKKGAGWVPKIFDQAEEHLEKAGGRLSNKRLKFNAWKRKLHRMSANEAIDSLLQLADAELMPVIYNEYSEEKKPALRSVYMEFFAAARPVSSIQIKALVATIVEHGSEKALDYLTQADFDQKLAASYLAKSLGDKNNVKINRAAYALGELKATTTILALANALETTHLVSKGDAGRVTQSFGNAGGGSTTFGGGGPKNRTVQNEEVLEALKKITEQDFGYNQEAYNRWYVKNYTNVGLKSRR